MFARLLIFIMLFAVVSCNSHRENNPSGEEGQHVVIEGALENGKDHLVTLDLMGTTAFIPLDSVRCDRNGKFSIRVKSDGLAFYSLKYTEQGYITIIAEPGDRVKVTGNADSLYPYSIEGSEASEKVGILARQHRKVLDELMQISELSESMAGEPGYARRKLELNARFDSITSAFHQFSKEFIHRYAPSPALLIALYNQFGPGLPVFHPLTDLGIYQYVDSVLYKHYPENEAVRSLHSQLSAAMQQMRNQQETQQLEIGDKAPDFVMETIDRQKLALSELRGNYVLIQFWASWSKPSVDQNRFLEEAYNRYSGKNFSIISISIDENREEWMDAVTEKSEGWYHVSDLLRWNSPVVDLYRVERIPANFLIDPAGTIIEKDIFGEDIIKKIQKYTD